MGNGADDGASIEYYRVLWFWPDKIGDKSTHDLYKKKQATTVKLNLRESIPTIWVRVEKYINLYIYTNKDFKKGKK